MANTIRQRLAERAERAERAAVHGFARAPQAEVQLVSIADLPTRFGHFRAVAFTPDSQGKEHLAIVRGQVRGARSVPVRVHSECLTGDVIGSLRCDCRDQLEQALAHLGTLKEGVLLYLRQEGRGIGLTNKIRAYALQDDGHDTVEANHLLGFGDDERDYTVAADMLRALGVKSVKLMTNNPRKVTGLRERGITVAGRIPIVIAPNRHNAEYLRTKQRRSGHWLGVLPGVEPMSTMKPAIPAISAATGTHSA
ncbi:MAG: GTP cyclohydrolase II [Candidatus Eisenbacteria bacterium]|nr:GTP cyclohydrolase II [Candidatus Eisenbacteria bacterium]